MVLTHIFKNGLSNMEGLLKRSAPVDVHGWLKVSANKIVDQRGIPFIPRGISLFWSQWMPHFYNSNVIRWLCQDWRINTIRMSMAVHHGGYLDSPNTERNKIETILNSAIENGIYVIVDWHAHLNEYEAAAAFFKDLAIRYSHHPNIIYEPWNEPNASYDWCRDIRPYHERVATEIRQHDPRRLIVVGTANYCQRIDEAVLNPLDMENIVYAVHFYAASHQDMLRQRIERALKQGQALLASEYGTCEATGDGRFDAPETRRWWRFLEERQIGYINWSLADKAETAAALKPGADPNGGWALSNLTESGKLVRQQLRRMASWNVTQSYSSAV